MSNKKSLKVAMEIAFMVSAAGVATVLHNAPASAQSYVSGEAKAQVLSQLTGASAGILDFGKVVPTITSGTVTIAADGTITNANGARYVPNSGAHVATLAFTGQPGQSIVIDAPLSTTITNGVNLMSVAFQYPPLPTTIGVDGNVAMNYGGILSVGANQVAGLYSGTYDIYVTYVA